MAAAFRQWFGAELPGRFGDAVGKLQVVNEPFPAQLLEPDSGAAPRWPPRDRARRLRYRPGRCGRRRRRRRRPSGPVGGIPPRTTRPTRAAASSRAPGRQTGSRPYRGSWKTDIGGRWRAGSAGPSPPSNRAWDRAPRAVGRPVNRRTSLADRRRSRKRRRALVGVVSVRPPPSPLVFSPLRARADTSPGVGGRSPNSHFNPLMGDGLCEAVTIAQPSACSRCLA